MFPLNRLYTFYALYITPPILQCMSPSKVNNVKSIHQLTFNASGVNIIDYFNDISSDSYT